MWTANTGTMTSLLPNGPRSMEKLRIVQCQAACAPLRPRNLQVLQFVSLDMLPGTDVLRTEIQVCLAGQDKGFCLDPFHGSIEVSYHFSATCFRSTVSILTNHYTVLVLSSPRLAMYTA